MTKYDFSPGTPHYESLFFKTTGSQPRGYTALHFACSASYRDFNNAEIVQLLLKRRSDMEAREKNGNTPLMLAISAGLVPTVKVLLQSRADVHATSARGLGVWEFVPQKGGPQGQGLKQLLQQHHARKTWPRQDRQASPRQPGAPWALARELRYKALHGPDYRGQRGEK